MKNRFMILSLCATLFFSCQEDSIRPLVVDNGIAPGVVENVMVQNLAGAAKLTYNLPTDDDLLYVEAEFKRQSTGTVSRVRSSVFNNSLVVEGFGEEKDYEVNLYAVDQSENKSEAVTTIIHPEKAPLGYVVESLKAFADFGGLHLYWKNKYEGNVSLEISVLNEFGLPEVVDVVYSSQQKGDYAVRGFDTTERTFQVIVKDRYDNISEPQYFVITPLFEQYLDRIYYKAIVQTHDTPNSFSRWTLDNLFDGITTGNHGFLTAGDWIDPDGELPEYVGAGVVMFTIDLGVTAKISRLKWWQRANKNYPYNGNNPKFYDIWGSDHLNADGSLDGWVKLVDRGTIIKPSGLPLGENTTEDVDAAVAGHDVIADASAPPVRYIRWVNLQNWYGTTAVHIMELEAYGQIVK